MNPIFKKLNLKDEQLLLILNAPSSFEPTIADLEPSIKVVNTIENDNGYAFILAFVYDAQGIASLAVDMKDSLSQDAKFWIAYPKKSSKKYKTDISRDHGWQPIGDLGYEGVRQVAIDEDWSALRFRHVDFIKVMKRNTKKAMSKKGKTRTS